MSLFNFFKNELLEIIQWQQNSVDETLCYKFPHHNNSIKNGAKLIVREGQRALFLSQGTLPPADAPPSLVKIETQTGPGTLYVGDSFGPGTYSLETRNLPILSTIQGWKYGFESPFKCDIYFVSTRRFTNQKWGTSNPIMLRDPEFGPVRIRAFGTYALQVADAALLLKELVSTDPSFETYEIADQLRSLIVTKFSAAIGKAGIPVLDMAGHKEQLGDVLREAINVELAPMGLSTPMFYVENISLPAELEKALDQRGSMGILGNLDQFTKFQAANALRDAAANPGGGGGVGAGMGLGAGVALGNQMASVLSQANQPGAGAGAAAAASPSAMPPPLPTAEPAEWFAAIGGQQSGPLTLSALRQQAQSGQLQRDTLVWKAGMASWAAASSIADLTAIFAAVPPPLPPPAP